MCIILGLAVDLGNWCQLSPLRLKITVITKASFLLKTFQNCIEYLLIIWSESIHQPCKAVLILRSSVKHFLVNSLHTLLRSEDIKNYATIPCIYDLMALTKYVDHDIKIEEHCRKEPSHRIMPSSCHARRPCWLLVMLFSHIFTLYNRDQPQIQMHTYLLSYLSK